MSGDGTFTSTTDFAVSIGLLVSFSALIAPFYSMVFYSLSISPFIFHRPGLKPLRLVSAIQDLSSLFARRILPIILKCPIHITKVFQNVIRNLMIEY